MIANKIIASALRRLLVTTGGASPSAQEYADGLEALNDLVKLISAQVPLIYEDTREEIVIASGTQEFTLGSTGDYVTDKPEEVLNATLRANNQTYPLEIVDNNIFSRLNDLTAVSRPEYLYYRQTYPDSTFYFDSTTEQEYTLVLTSMKALTQFADGTTDVPLPDIYEPYFKANLTVSLAPEFGAANRVTQIMLIAAEDTKNAITGRSVQSRVSTTELANANGYSNHGYNTSQDGNR